MSFDNTAQSDTMARRGAKEPHTEDLLKQLNQDFQRSKTEQIQRFLTDQNDLNRKFREFDLNSEDDEAGDSDTESVFSQRMAVYKVRPESVLGGITLDKLFKNEDDNLSVTSTAANFSDSDEERSVRDWKDNVYDRNRNITRVNGQHVGRQVVPQRDSSRGSTSRRGQGQANEEDFVSRPQARQEKKLLVRRQVRPRTATGITSIKTEEINDTLVTLGNAHRAIDQSDNVDQGARISDKLPAATPRLRASAPAATTRVRGSNMDGDFPVETDHVVERAAARQGFMKESQNIKSYGFTNNSNAFTKQTQNQGMTVPSITARTDRVQPSYASNFLASNVSNMCRSSSMAKETHNGTTGGSGISGRGPEGRTNNTGPATSRVETRDARSRTNVGITRNIPVRDRTTAYVEISSKVPETNFSSPTTTSGGGSQQRFTSTFQWKAQIQRPGSVSSGTAAPHPEASEKRGFVGSQLRAAARDTSRDRERSRERRSGHVTSHSAALSNDGGPELQHAKHASTATSASSRHVTVLKLPRLQGGRTDPRAPSRLGDQSGGIGTNKQANGPESREFFA